jgi:hypothetical protein
MSSGHGAGSPCSSHQPGSWPAASGASGLGESYSCSGLQFGQLGGVVLSPFERGCPSGAGAGQDVEGQVAATLGPVVVLFGEYGADQAGDRVAVGEDPHDVGPPADLAVERSLGLLDQI